jgi:hypothetical protein
MRWSLLGLVLCGCQQISWFQQAKDLPDPRYPDVNPEACPPDSQVTWRNHAKPLIDTWCTTCHTSLLSGEDRKGAPANVDFDTYQGVFNYRDRIHTVATGDSPRMPPAGGIPDIDRERLREWINCGAAGTPDNVSLCDSLSPQPGSVTIASAEEAEAFCASGNNAVEDDLIITGGDFALDCLCEVGGNLTIAESSSSDVGFSELLHVDGAVSITNNLTLTSVALPELLDVGWDAEPGSRGGVTVTGNSVLTEIDWPWLKDIGGNYVISQNEALVSVATSHTVHINGALTLIENPMLSALNLERLRFVDGPFTLDDNGSLDSLESTASVERLGGKLTIMRQPVLTEIGGFLSVSELLGDVEIAENDALEIIDGFTALYDLTGDIHIYDNPSLLQLNGFQHLEEMHGDIWVHDNAALERVNGGFVNLVTLDGDLTFADNPGLFDINGFATLYDIGSLTLTGLPLLAEPTSFATVSSVTGSVIVTQTGAAYLGLLDNALNIDGEVRIENNDSLEAITGFNRVTAVGEGLFIQDNDALLALPSFQDLSTVNGDVILSNNLRLEQPHSVTSLIDIGGSLHITDNETLFSVGQLSSLMNVDMDVVITGNTELPSSQADTLAAGIDSVGGSITVSGNGPG